jgi:transcriptional regulator with XRE-family HTH domain
MTGNPAADAKERAVAEKLARFLADLREQQHINVAEVAKRAAISLDRLRLAETGQATLSSIELRRLANALGVPEIILLAEFTLLTRIHRARGAQATDGNGEVFHQQT